MSAPLIVHTRRNLSLLNALSAYAKVVGDTPATAILYSPRKCRLARWDRNELTGPDDQRVDDRNVFEARVFCQTAELRWLNDPSPKQEHRAVILSEQDDAQKLDDWACERRTDVLARLEQTYLLWGEGTQRPMRPGWSELATARIGPLSVPIDGVGLNERVLLHTVEYVVEGDHGNAVVYDERLVKLEVDRG